MKDCEYNVASNSKMGIRTLAKVCTMNNSQQQTKDGFLITLQFPNTPTNESSCQEIQDTLIEIFNQNVSKIFFKTEKEDHHE